MLTIVHFVANQTTEVITVAMECMLDVSGAIETDKNRNSVIITAEDMAKKEAIQLN